MPEKDLESCIAQLYCAVKNDDLSLDDKLQLLLKNALDYLGLKIGIISRIEGKTYTVQNVLIDGDGLKPGDEFEFEGTYCVDTYNSQTVKTWNHAGKSDIATHPCYINFQLESYIGAPLYVNNELFGTVNFTSPEPHAPFDEKDTALVRLITEMVSAEMAWATVEENRLANERNLNKLLAKLTISNEQLEHFTHTASTDMQAPLKLISGYTKLALDECSQEEHWKIKGYLDLIMESCADIEELTSDMVEYSRVGEDMKIYEVNFEDIIRYVKEKLGDTIESNKAQIHYHANLPRVNCNPTQLIRLMQNLIANAIKYQKPGNIPEIYIGVNESDDNWLFSVQDNGIGLKEENADTIFQPFKRLNSSATYSGTGIGLAICKKIMDNLNGRIWVESKFGHGSTFRFSIPKSVEVNDNDCSTSKIVI